MQTAINYFAGLNKTTVKQFITVSGIIVFFALAFLVIVLVMVGNMDAVTNILVAMVAVGAVTGVVGWEFF